MVYGTLTTTDGALACKVYQEFSNAKTYASPWYIIDVEGVYKQVDGKYTCDLRKVSVLKRHL